MAWSRGERVKRMEWCCGSVAGFAVFVVIAAVVQHHWHLRALLKKIMQKREELGSQVQQWFMVQPCFRCHEFRMELLEISPNGRSVHYQCQHCKKKSRAPAGTPDAPRTIEVWNELQSLAQEYNAMVGWWKRDKKADLIVIDVVFVAPADPLPYEQTSRTPIPEAVRSEVWRRDGGRCVQCGSNQNLQYDHIIPVSHGGATSVANLQLLCQPCNAAKGKKI